LFILTIKTNEQYPHLQEKNIDYGHNKMNNTLVDEGLGSLLEESIMQHFYCINNP
jgi:hypothetical protein